MHRAAPTTKHYLLQTAFVARLKTLTYQHEKQSLKAGKRTEEAAVTVSSLQPRFWALCSGMKLREYERRMQAKRGFQGLWGTLTIKNLMHTVENKQMLTKAAQWLIVFSAKNWEIFQSRKHMTYMRIIAFSSNYKDNTLTILLIFFLLCLNMYFLLITVDPHYSWILYLLIHLLANTFF